MGIIAVAFVGSGRFGLHLRSVRGRQDNLAAQLAVQLRARGRQQLLIACDDYRSVGRPILAMASTRLTPLTSNSCVCSSALVTATGFSAPLQHAHARGGRQIIRAGL